MAAKCYVQLPALKGRTFPVRVETTHDQIEKEMPFALNRSKSYLLCHDEMFGTHIRVQAKATITCYGCSYDGDDGIDPRGGGCDECGYTGKRVWSEWVPATTKNAFHKGDYKDKPTDADALAEINKVAE